MSARTRAFLEAAGAGDVRQALDVCSALLNECPDSPYLLVWRAILIQAQDDPASALTLQDAEQSLLRAYGTDANYLPALEELAHFYDAVEPDAMKARKYAREYLEKSYAVVHQLREIIEKAS
jgi:hypothetical protein